MDNDRDILLVSIFTLITICAWIFFELVKTTQTSTTTTATKQLIKPVQSTIDGTILTTLSERVVYR